MPSPFHCFPFNIYYFFEAIHFHWTQFCTFDPFDLNLPLCTSLKKGLPHILLCRFLKPWRDIVTSESLKSRLKYAASPLSPKPLRLPCHKFQGVNLQVGSLHHLSLKITFLQVFYITQILTGICCIGS